MDRDIDRILLHHDQIAERVRELAAEIAAVYDAREPSLTLVPILSGSIIFLADLIRELPLKMKIALVSRLRRGKIAKSASQRGTRPIHPPVHVLC